MIRLGLLEIADEGPERLVISTRGRATWRRFLERGGQFPEDLTSLTRRKASGAYGLQDASPRSGQPNTTS
jgi:hypothetical protein